jgi:hypothetical protein
MLKAALTFRLGHLNIQFDSDHYADDCTCTPDVDDQWNKEIHRRNDLVHGHPQSSMCGWEYKHTHSVVVITIDNKYLEKDEFVRRREENESECDQHEMTSDVWLFEPLLTQEYRCENTFKCNE